MPTHAAAEGAGTVVPVRPEAGVASNAIHLRALTNTNVRGRSICAAVHVCVIRPLCGRGPSASSRVEAL